MKSHIWTWNQRRGTITPVTQILSRTRNPIAVHRSPPPVLVTDILLLQRELLVVCASACWVTAGKRCQGIQKNIKGSRRIRRLINNFPYYRLVQYIKYEAAWTSIRTLKISEADTSNTCFNC